MAWAIVFAKGTNHNIGGLTKVNWIFLLLSGCATGLSWIFYFKALQLGEVAQVAPVDKLSVPIAIILAAIFLNEPLTLKTVSAAVLIVAGTFILII